MYIDEATRRWDPPLGTALYLEALQYFRRASALLPDDEAPFRHEAMALAERGSWDELELISRRRAKLRPAQAWPWMTLGLAEHRLGHLEKASVAFDAGFGKLPPDERARLMSLKRLLPTGQLAFADTMAAPQREQLTDMYWALANPTLLLEGNAVLNEFRARVVHSELLWTNEEYKMSGADTDRGEIFVRWGPPDDISTYAPTAVGFVPLSWMYRRTGLNFFFRLPPTLGVARIEQFYRGNMLEPNMAKRPAIWENVPVMRRGVDSLPVQIARFRGTADSIDVAVFAGIRAGALRAGMPTDTNVLKTGLFAIDAAGQVVARVTNTIRTGEKDTLALTSQRWRTRIPATTAYVRVEALETDALRIARAIRQLDGFTTAGFGTSDVLIGSRITSPTNLVDARWSDFTVAPVNGNTIRSGQPLDLLWEVYLPTVVDGTARYRVSLVVQRVEQKGLVAVSAKVLGSVRDAIVRAGRQDRVAIEYDRSVAGAALYTESLRLDLGSARRGRYVLTVTVQDLQAERSVTRRRELTIF
jgi:GWxTD domain-containing protein